MKLTDEAYRRGPDFDRGSREFHSEEPLSGLLVIVTGATAITTGVGGYRWLYTWAEAQLGPPPNYLASQKTNPITGEALSISELGNTLTTVAFGIAIANIPAGFAPVRIPNGTPVWAVPQRLTNGTLLWLILNTQAIDGTCP